MRPSIPTALDVSTITLTTEKLDNSPSILLPYNSTAVASLFPSLSSFHYQSIQLEELAHHRLSLRHISSACHSRARPTHNWTSPSIHPSSDLQLHTFNTCSSFNPCCVNSCIRRASLSVLCSRNASLVLRFAYSLKLYAANWFDWRRSERKSDRTSKLVVLAIVGNLVKEMAMRQVVADRPSTKHMVTKRKRIFPQRRKVRRSPEATSRVEAVQTRALYTPSHIINRLSDRSVFHTRYCYNTSVTNF